MGVNYAARHDADGFYTALHEVLTFTGISSTRGGSPHHAYAQKQL